MIFYEWKIPEKIKFEKITNQKEDQIKYLLYF